MAGELKMDVREKLVGQKIKGDGESICYKCFHNKVCKAVDNQPCVECNQFVDANSVTVQEWIPVGERLPKRDDMVIAFYPTMRGTSGEMQIHKAWAMSETCTHWMPLPQPPKGE